MKPISIRLDDLTQEALVFLRGQPGGYNLNQAVKRIILDSAIGRGWSPGSVVQDRPTKSKVVPAAKATKVVQEHTGTNNSDFGSIDQAGSSVLASAKWRF